MGDRPRVGDRPPRWVSLFNRIAKPLLAARVPMLFNRLVTIRGRTTGIPRTTPLTVIEIGGRRWVWSPWGEVNWVRNLRAAGAGTVNVKGRNEEVRATELDDQQRVAFFRDVMGPFARRVRPGVWLVRVVDGVDLDNPVEAANGRPVFELYRRDNA